METIAHAKLIKANKTHKCMFCCQLIEKGSNYYKSTHVQDGDIYDWKTHTYCQDIASKLKMYEDCDEGLGTDDFIEHIRCEYQDKMSKTQNEVYESKDFKYPPFIEQLLWVMKFHGIEPSQDEQRQHKDR